MTLAQLADLETALAATAPANGQQLLDAATLAVESWLGWSPAEADGVTHFCDTEGTTTVQLPSMHVRAVTAVELLAIDGVTVEQAITDFEWSRSGIVTYRAAFPQRLSGAKVTFNGGWTDGDRPAVFGAVVAALAARAASLPIGVQSELLGSYQISYAVTGGHSGPLSLGLAEQDALARWRLPTLTWGGP